MKVVFLEDVEGVALGGDVKEVKNGFARNYLIPQGLAAPATHNNVQKITKLSQQAESERIQRLDDMKQLSEAIDGTEIIIEMRAGSNDRLYGSVTGTMVADALNEITGQSIERRLVQLDNPIRELGSFDVPIRLHSDVTTIVKVKITADGNIEEDSELEESPEPSTISEDDHDNVTEDRVTSHESDDIAEQAIDETLEAEEVITKEQ